MYLVTRFRCTDDLSLLFLFVFSCVCALLLLFFGVEKKREMHVCLLVPFIEPILLWCFRTQRWWAHGVGWAG